MPATISADGGVVQYSRVTGFIYVFNLIVGTGALTLPAAFHNAGWALSTVVLIMLSFMSFLTTTFMIESMAAANAIVHWKRLQSLKRSESVCQDDVAEAEAEEVASQTTSPIRTGINSLTAQHSPPHIRSTEASDDEHEPLLSHEVPPPIESVLNGELRVVQRRHSSLVGSRDNLDRIPSVSNYYNITEIIEMGKMASLFFNKFGRTLFYLCIAIYLYGDLAIYSAAVAKSLRDVACTYKPDNSTGPLSNLNDTSPCWPDANFNRINAYRVALSVFILIVGPFGFFNVSKTKYLQILTTIMRWFAFGAMVTLACVRLGQGKRAHPPIAEFSGVPNLFGVCVYSFMCHHSLPSLITPVKEKRNITWLIASDFMLVMLFYILLAFTGIFAFEELNDLYTLNFQPVPGEPWYLAAIHYFLSLFPVFTLSTNFPIITITLRNNLKALCLTEGRRYSWWTRNCLFPILALVPPVGVAFATNSLEFLVGITGSYAGAGIQYIVPAFLAYYSRKKTQTAIGIGVVNQHSSWFRSTLWIVFVQAWAIGCIALVTWNHIATAVKK